MCVFVYQLLTLTLRLSLGVEDLSRVCERRLLGTVGIPEDSKATAPPLKTTTHRRWFSKYLTPVTIPSTLNNITSSLSSLCNTGGKLPARGVHLNHSFYKYHLNRCFFLFDWAFNKCHCHPTWIFFKACFFFSHLTSFETTALMPDNVHFSYRYNPLTECKQCFIL